jgi:hypothetical protein
VSYVDFADVKARCSVKQAAGLVGRTSTEERLQLRAPASGMQQRRPIGRGGPLHRQNCQSSSAFQARSSSQQDCPDGTPRKGAVFSILTAAARGCPGYR